ncbi:RHG10 protein, partial [Polypterus senegalus]
MGLHPLEFSDCYLDSPKFRERIRAHELELEKTNRFIKELQKDGKNLFAATKNIIAAQRKFAQTLSDFKFEYIGDAKTDDEKCIGEPLNESLHEFSVFLKNLEDQREIMMININETLLKPLEKFRKEQLGAAKEERKKYEKETEKYCTALDKLLNLSAKKKDQQLQEADVQVEQMKQHFHEESLEYIYKLQEIQERKKFECVEPMVAFFQGVFTFYHQGYELANDFNHYKTELQINIQNTRNRFEGTRSEVIELKNKVKQNPQEHLQTSRLCTEGYLYVQEKRPPPFGSSWVKKYCTYMKEQKIFNMFSFDPRSGGKMGEPESVILKSCTKKPMDSIDRRFCLEIEVTDRQGLVITVQALSEEDRKQWMEAMGGKESVSTLCRTYAKREGTHFQTPPSDCVFLVSFSVEAHLNEVGFSLVRNCIRAVESRGIKDQGLYRVVGVSSRVQKLLNILIDEKSYTEVDLSASEDWEIKTVTSALKQYLRVSENCKENLMTVANLGVVFGPTLMRSEEETVAAIMDLKFQNIVVEILIENYETIFKTVPNSSCTAALSSSPSAPPRLSRRQSQRQNRPLAVYNPQMELQPAECPNSVREDTLVDSTESVSSHSSNATTSSASGSPPEKAKNRRRSSGGEFFDLDRALVYPAQGTGPGVEDLQLLNCTLLDIKFERNARRVLWLKKTPLTDTKPSVCRLEKNNRQMIKKTP